MLVVVVMVCQASWEPSRNWLTSPLYLNFSTEETPARRILPQNLGAVGCKVILKRAICRCSKGEVGGQAGVEGWEGWEGEVKGQGVEKVDLGCKVEERAR